MMELIKSLSSNEKDCFDFMLKGYTYKKIAYINGIALGSVANTAHRVLKKLDMPDRITMILKYYNLPSWMDAIP